MTILDGYITRTFLSGYVIMLLVGIGLFVAADIVANLDEFLENPDDSLGVVVQKMVDYHAHRLPLYFHQLGGVVLALAASFTFAMMLRNNELTPLVAAGVPLQRLVVPVLMASVGLVGLWLANSELLMPAWATKIARTHDDLHGARDARVLCVRDDNNAILSADDINARQGWLRQVYIIAPDEHGNPTELISADQATYDPAAQTWYLTRGSRLLMGPAFEQGDLGREIRRVPLETYPFRLTPEQILLRQSSQWADLMSIRAMNGLLQSRNLPNLPAVAQARDVRFSQPLLMWILILLTVPFFLTREPTNVLAAGGKALLLGGLCFAFTFGMHCMPYAQIWIALPVLAFGPAAVLHLANAKT